MATVKRFKINVIRVTIVVEKLRYNILYAIFGKNDTIEFCVVHEDTITKCVIRGKKEEFIRLKRVNLNRVK